MDQVFPWGPYFVSLRTVYYYDDEQVLATVHLDGKEVYSENMGHSPVTLMTAIKAVDHYDATREFYH